MHELNNFVESIRNAHNRLKGAINILRKIAVMPDPGDRFSMCAVHVQDEKHWPGRESYKPKKLNIMIFGKHRRRL